MDRELWVDSFYLSAVFLRTTTDTLSLTEVRCFFTFPLFLCGDLFLLQDRIQDITLHFMVLAP